MSEETGVGAAAAVNVVPQNQTDLFEGVKEIKTTEISSSEVVDNVHEKKRRKKYGFRCNRRNRCTQWWIWCGGGTLSCCFPQGNTSPIP
jgi:hypothetical protein